MKWLRCNLVLYQVSLNTGLSLDYTLVAGYKMTTHELELALQPIRSAA